MENAKEKGTYVFIENRFSTRLQSEALVCKIFVFILEAENSTCHVTQPVDLDEAIEMVGKSLFEAKVSVYTRLSFCLLVFYAQLQIVTI